MGENIHRVNLFCSRPDQRELGGLEDIHDEQKRLSHCEY